MARLPQPGGDAGNWGEILNDYLAQAHDSTGKLKNTGVLAAKYTKPANGIPESDLEQGVKDTLDTIPEHTTTLAQHDTDIAAVATRIDGSLKADGSLKEASVTRAALADEVAVANERAAVLTAPGLLYPDHLNRWWAKLADARNVPRVITTLGDSITRGQYANNQGSIDDAVFAQRGYVGHLRAAAKERGLDTGYGGITLADPRVVSVGAQNIQTYGIAQAGKRLDSGDLLTISTPACTDIVIHAWWDSNANSAPYGYTVDGGSPVTSSRSSGTSGDYFTDTITGLANTTHTLVISGPTTKLADISWIECLTETTKGLRVHRFSISGGLLDNYVRQTSDSGQTQQLRAHFLSTNTDLAILAFGANESGLSGQSGGHTPALFGELLTVVTSYVTDTIGATALIVCGPRRDPSSVGTSYPEEAYYDAAKAVAAANPNVAAFDLSLVWGSHAAATSSGYMYDVIHPNRLGHADMGRLIAQAIGL